MRRRAFVIGALSAGAVSLGVLALTRQRRSEAEQAAEAAIAADVLGAAVQVERCNGRNAIGVGLLGEYFARAGFQGEMLVSRVDPTVDFDADLNWPADSQPKQARSVRWRGWIKPPLQGVYRFHGGGVSDARIEVAGVKLAGAGAAPDAHIEMVAGRFYEILFEVPALPTDGSRVRLEWTVPHGARYLVPRPLLFLPTESVKQT
jgi:hypothetical protein